MAQEKIAELVGLIDKVSTRIDDWDYMTAMTLLQQLYHLNQSAQNNTNYMGPPNFSAEQLIQENERLQYNNTRLKRSHRNKKKIWRQTEEQLRGQINELLNEIEYLEQFKK